MRRAPIPYAIAYVTLSEGADDDDQHRRLRPRQDPHRAGRPARLQAERRRTAGTDVYPDLMLYGSPEISVDECGFLLRSRSDSRHRL
jgi:hypothetical protein